MGHHKVGSIEYFHPDDDENTIYIPDNVKLDELVDIVEQKWPGIDLSTITIESDYIHTSCLTYDLYDPSDYTKFIVVRRD